MGSSVSPAVARRCLAASRAWRAILGRLAATALVLGPAAVHSSAHAADASAARLEVSTGETDGGPVQIVGYTDNQPIKTVRFPSNFALSAARAEAAKDLIDRALGQPGRITAIGKADADPVASNATDVGRDENRRIEVILRRQG